MHVQHCTGHFVSGGGSYAPSRPSASSGRRVSSKTVSVSRHERTDVGACNRISGIVHRSNYAGRARTKAASWPEKCKALRAYRSSSVGEAAVGETISRAGRLQSPRGNAGLPCSTGCRRSPGLCGARALSTVGLERDQTAPNFQTCG
jgi:hypothetical protein